jgi:hypothetical protein
MDETTASCSYDSFTQDTVNKFTILDEDIAITWATSHVTWVLYAAFGISVTHAWVSFEVHFWDDERDNLLTSPKWTWLDNCWWW